MTFIILPISGILILLWAISKNKVFGKLLGIIWIGVLGLIMFVSIVHFLTTKKRVEKSDIYGQYVIDRDKFSGKQADWQYESFRFEITKEDELIFHETRGIEIINTDTAKVEFLEQYINDRIRINRDIEMHHVIDTEPTLYRNTWSFYYVFKSQKFGNMFFKKGKWKPIN